MIRVADWGQVSVKIHAGSVDNAGHTAGVLLLEVTNGCMSEELLRHASTAPSVMLEIAGPKGVRLLPTALV
jgi:hypothetical protein